MKLKIERRGSKEWKKVPLKGGVRALVVLVSCIALGGGTITVWHVKNTDALASVTLFGPEPRVNPVVNTISGKSTSSEAILLALGRHMIVPKEHTAPHVAMIIDAPSLAREQDFYRGAENGDALIVFPESHVAVIFGVRRDRIVTTGPVRLKSSDKEAVMAVERTISANASTTEKVKREAQP